MPPSQLSCPVHAGIPDDSGALASVSSLPATTAPHGIDLDEALEFIEQFHAENPSAGSVAARREQVRASILSRGHYEHTSAELAWGARVAWRNSARCVGRLYWNSLIVNDLRGVQRADDVADHCRRHLRLAGNRGKIRPVISVFGADRPDRPAPLIWNEQLIRYAGYARPDGSVLGDPRYLGFTATAQSLGWVPPAEPSAFDVLPLIVETADEGVRMYPLSPDDVLEVELSHPDYPWFAELGLRWHAVPAISNMRLRMGGLSYPAAPFNGWYMGAEIGARNLVDLDRYNLAEPIARRLGLDLSSEQTLWRDRSVIEINRAVLHSFNAAGVTVTDHHTETQRFLTHVAKEERAGRSCPADWSWIVPPISGALTPVFHRYYDGPVEGPQFVADTEATMRARMGQPVQVSAGSGGSGGSGGPGLGRPTSVAAPLA